MADSRHTRAGGGYRTRSDAFWIASKQAVAREGEIETGTGGPPVANAVHHARRKLRDISFLPEALEYQIVCEFRNRYREFESTSLRQPVSGLRHSPRKCAKYARVAAMRTAHRHRRTLNWWPLPVTSIISLWASNPVPMPAIGERIVRAGTTGIASDATGIASSLREKSLA